MVVVAPCCFFCINRRAGMSSGQLSWSARLPFHVPECLCNFFPLGTPGAVTCSSAKWRRAVQHPGSSVLYLPDVPVRHLESVKMQGNGESGYGSACSKTWWVTWRRTWILSFLHSCSSLCSSDNSRIFASSASPSGLSHCRAMEDAAGQLSHLRGGRECQPISPQCSQGRPLPQSIWKAQLRPAQSRLCTRINPSLQTPLS